MEFHFNVNEFLNDEITLIDNQLLPVELTEGNGRKDWPTLRRFQENLIVIMNEMGEASRIAQSLQQTITNAERLKNSDHLVYLLKDATKNNGKGAIIGLLKIGKKNLFVYDQNGKHHELVPMCVLDFYVHESKQRMGCGLKLFKHMLKENEIGAQHLAVDRPSDKFLFFLRRHYGLTQMIPQVNNFVVFENFFDGIIDWNCIPTSRRPRSPQAGVNESKFLNRKPKSAIQLEDSGTYEPRTPIHTRNLKAFTDEGRPKSERNVGMIIQGGGSNNQRNGSIPHSPVASHKINPVTHTFPHANGDSNRQYPAPPTPSSSGTPSPDAVRRVFDLPITMSPDKNGFNDSSSIGSTSPKHDSTDGGTGPYRDLKFVHQRLW